MENLKKSFYERIDEFNDLYDKICDRFLYSDEEPADEDIKEATAKLIEVKNNVASAIEMLIVWNNEHEEDMRNSNSTDLDLEKVMIAGVEELFSFDVDMALGSVGDSIYHVYAILMSILTIKRDKKDTMDKDFHEIYELIMNVTLEEIDITIDEYSEKLIILLKELYDKNKLEKFLESNLYAYDKENSKKLVKSRKRPFIDKRKLSDQTSIITPRSALLFTIETKFLKGSFFKVGIHLNNHCKMLNSLRVLIKNLNYFKFIEIVDGKVSLRKLEKLLELKNVFFNLTYILEEIQLISQFKDNDIEGNLKDEKAVNIFGRPQLEKLISAIGGDLKTEIMELTIGDLVKLITSFIELVKTILGK